MVTKNETYLYGQLFALAQEQLAAIEKLVGGRLGLWGKGRFGARTKRIEKVLFQLFLLKQKVGYEDMAAAISEIDNDLVALHGTWGDVSDKQLGYLQNICRGLL